VEAPEQTFEDPMIENLKRMYQSIKEEGAEGRKNDKEREK
jgi:hypothetical protein